MLISSVFTNPILEAFIAALRCQDWFKALFFLVLLCLLTEQSQKVSWIHDGPGCYQQKMASMPSVRTISKDSQDKCVLEVASCFQKNCLLVLFPNCSTVRAKYSSSN